MFTCKAGYGFQAGESSRIIVRIHDRLELRNKDRNVPVVELRSINCDGGSGTTGAWSKLTNRVHVESGPG